MAEMTLSERVSVLFYLSVATAICHGVCWILTERLFDWQYGVGPRIPTGWPAATLSLSLTLPLLAVALLYGPAFGTRIVAPRHAYASCFAIVGGATAYLLLFGIGHDWFPGLRAIVLRHFENHPVRAEVLATAAYAAILVPFISIPYRFAAHGLTAFPSGRAALLLGPPLLASVFTFGCIAAYVLLVQPNAVELKRPEWIHLRGFVAGMATVLGACIALYA
jgi:hypothetical protein